MNRILIMIPEIGGVVFGVVLFCCKYERFDDNVTFITKFSYGWRTIYVTFGK